MFKKNLEQNLQGASSIALLGIGSELRGDDRAGLLVVEGVTRRAADDRAAITAFWGSTAPENLTGEIREMHPSHVVIVDSADMGMEPGAVRLLDPLALDGVSFSTHRLPTKILADYLIQTLGCVVIVIGMQPRTISIGAATSPVIEQASDTLAAMLFDLAPRARNAGGPAE